MGQVLNATTVVRNPETTAVVLLRAGTEVPEWAADLVGDHLTAGGDYAAGGEGTSQEATGHAADTTPAEVHGAHTRIPEADDQDEPPADHAEPPRAGRGSGIDAWKAYAAAVGVDVPDDATRDAIIELVDEKNPR